MDEGDFPPMTPPPRRLLMDPDAYLARALDLIARVRHIVDTKGPPADLAMAALELAQVVERLHEWLADGNSPPKAWPLASSLLLVRTGREGLA